MSKHLAWLRGENQNGKTTGGQKTDALHQSHCRDILGHQYQLEPKAYLKNEEIRVTGGISGVHLWLYKGSPILAEFCSTEEEEKHPKATEESRIHNPLENVLWPRQLGQEGLQQHVIHHLPLYEIIPDLPPSTPLGVNFWKEWSWPTQHRDPWAILPLITKLHFF